MLSLFKKSKKVLVVGLGNIGQEYTDTRHNVGFMLVDFLNNRQLNKSLFAHKKNLSSDTVEIVIGKSKLILAKPTTYMNESGVAVSSLKKYFQIENENIIVIHDDLDIKFGDWKQQLKGPRQHNGITSIEEHLKNTNFTRVRIGVDNRNEITRNIPGREYVLSKFTKEEINLLEEQIFHEVEESIKQILAQ